jgi:hypothetical protein
LRDLDGLDTKSTKVSRIAELLHRAIPYPAVLLLQAGDRLFLSQCHIRWAQKEADKTVLDGEHLFAMLVPDEFRSAFLAALALSKQPRSDLMALYQSWMDTLAAWQAAAVSGRFALSRAPAQATERRSALAPLSGAGCTDQHLCGSRQQRKADCPPSGGQPGNQGVAGGAPANCYNV